MSPSPPATAALAVGIDLGGSGMRLRTDRADDVHAYDRPTAGILAADPAGTIALIAAEIRSVCGGNPAAVGMGAAGLSTHADRGAGLSALLSEALDGAVVRVVSDIEAAHAGALGGAPGAVLAAGTGAIALGIGQDGTRVRVDGRGALLGDLGSGAWIGQQGLRAAARAIDLREAPDDLVAAAIARFGDLEGWPARVAGDDRAAVLASFAPDVITAARGGCPTAAGIVAQAVDALATTLCAAAPAGIPPLFALVGGLVASPDSPLGAEVAARVAALRPEAVFAPSPGTPLDGALLLVRR